MKTTHQSHPWHSPMTQPFSWGAQVVSGVGRAVSKTAHAWSRIPKAVKLPVATAMVLSSEWLGNKALTGGVVLMIETPKPLAAFFLKNCPVKIFGERWQLPIGSSFPSDPKAPLADLDKKIGSFERAQAILSPPIPSVKPMIPAASSDASVQRLRDLEKTTNAHLKSLSEKVSYLSILQTMCYYSGVSDSDSLNIPTLVDEASRMHHPSIWKLFNTHYGSKISMWGRFKAKVLYLFLWQWIPIIPKTVDGYLKNLLSELRVNLKENGEKRKKFMNGLLEDLDNFFDVYNGAVETYAHDLVRKGNLAHYQKNAVDLMIARGEASKGKSPDELKMDLYRKLSASIVDHCAPKIRFQFMESLLNYLIKKTLRDTLLPEVFLAISNEGKEATKRHNIPFFLALTKTLTTQIVNLQSKLEEGYSDPLSLGGLKNFEPIVKKFLWTIDIAECKTIEEIRLKQEKLKHPETGIDAVVRNGIQLGIQKGLAVLFDYLAKSENTEELFATLFESISSPLSGHLPMNDSQWAEMEIEYEGAKILLKEGASALSKQMVQEAVQDKVRGGSVPEATEKLAQKIFSEHKSRGVETYADLFRSTTTIQENIKKLAESYSDEASIHPHLHAIACSLKAFENKERVKITMDQDSPPQISLLPNADQETILRSLYPLYEGSNQIMDTVLDLQSLQTALSKQSMLDRIFKHMKGLVEEIAGSKNLGLSLIAAKKIQTHLKNIYTIFPETTQNFSLLREQLLAMHDILEQIGTEQKALNALANLQSQSSHSGLLHQLLLSVQGTPPPGFKKWKCLEQIKENLANANLSQSEQQRVIQWIEKISKYNALPEPRPDFKIAIWDPLLEFFSEHKIKLEKKQKRMEALLERLTPKLHKIVELEEMTQNQSCKMIWDEMNSKATKLHANVLKLHKMIDHAKKEILIVPSAAELGQIAGTMGFFLGLVLGKAAPELGPEMGGFIGGCTAAAIAGADSLAKGKWIKWSFSVLGTGAAGTFGAKKVAEAATRTLSHIPLISNLVGAAFASAGSEYLGVKVTKRVIDAGVEIAMPKVFEIFDKAYDHLLMNDIVINASLNIVMKQVVELFPPKK